VYALARGLTLPGLYRFGRFFGTVEWLINYKRRHRLTSRLQALFGEPLSRGAMRRASRRHFMRIRSD
jgi:hypothetical protein